tara:strand:+ start:874 stop:1080 length:207 start_codon:yes stop_codon:yes gene_type:complete
MKVKDLIKALQKLDPTGNLEIVVNAGCYDYPVDMGGPSIRYVEYEENDSWCEASHPHAEKVISVMADN